VTPESLRTLLGEVASGASSIADAERRLAWAPVEDLDFARVDHHRALRHGFPEVVFGLGKTPDQVVALAVRIAKRGEGFLATRLAPEAREPLRSALPAIELNELGRTAYLAPAQPVERRTRGTVLVVTAGTSDLPVAEEAAVTARAYGNPVERLTDVGVAGIHRLLDRVDDLADADAVVVLAGMEGALASVVGGLVAAPVVAVPTSTGYGAGLEGVTALLAMHASCAAGITVVGIDNGFGAACAVARIIDVRARHA